MGQTKPRDIIMYLGIINNRARFFFSDTKKETPNSVVVQLLVFLVSLKSIQLWSSKDKCTEHTRISLSITIHVHVNKWRNIHDWIKLLQLQMMCCKIVKLAQNSKFCKILGGGLNNVNFVEAANYIKLVVWNCRKLVVVNL